MSEKNKERFTTLKGHCFSYTWQQESVPSIADSVPDFVDISEGNHL